MIAILYTSIGMGCAINGIQGVTMGITITFATGFIFGIGFVILIFYKGKH
jgi:hypothetical protein